MISAELLSIIAPALVAGLMIAITHAPLGIEVLKRGIIFIDLAVAQIAGLGLIAAGMFLHEPALWLTQAVALFCAILAGLFFRKVEAIMPDQQEAIIGVSFVLAASLSILLLADHPHGGEEIQHILSGQMLFVTWEEVASSCTHLRVNINCLVLKACFTKRYRFLPSLCPCHHVIGAIGGGLRGICQPYLAGTCMLKSGTPYHRSMGLWNIIYIVRHAVATLLDLPAGPIIVCSYVFVAMVMAALLPKAFRQPPSK